MKKIAVASSSTVPSRTANSIQVVNMAAAFAALGYQVTLHCRSRRTEEPTINGSIFEFYGVPANFLLKKAPWQKKNFRTAILYGLLTSIRILIERPNILLSRNLLVSLVSGLAGVPTVHESHHIEGANSRLERLAFKAFRVSFGFRGIVAISNYLGTELSRRYQIEPRKILIAHDGSKVVSQEASNVNLKASLQRFQVGYSGSLYAGRGIEVIVALANACPWAVFTILGDSQKASLIPSEIPKNLIISGFIEPSKVARKLQEFDLLVAPYQEDTQDASGNVTVDWMSPLKVFEYMAAGKPILASNLTALREVLRHGENCHLVDPADLDGWVSALNLIANDKEYRVHLGARAKANQETLYTWSLRAEKIVAHADANETECKSLLLRNLSVRRIRDLLRSRSVT